MILRKGTFYVRRSGGNHLADSRDLNNLVERRIDQYKDILLNRIARVVDAPKESEVYVLSKDKDDPENRRFVIDSGPDALPIKGMSFTIAPDSFEEKIAAWIVLSLGNSEIIPPTYELWNWYQNKFLIEITEKQKLAVAQFCLWADAPYFYWLLGLRTQDIQKMVLETIKHRKSGIMVEPMMILSTFLGKSFYKSALSALGTYKSKLAPRMQSYPSGGWELFKNRFVRKSGQSEQDFRNSIENELNGIVQVVDPDSKIFQPIATERARAQILDCCLYAQNNKYA